MDVYLLPAVVGGGRGDIEETLAAGRHLARAGFPIHLYRPASRPWPRGVEGPWDWPTVERLRRLVPRHASALTVTPAWGVSAAPGTPAAFGRSGPWAVEAAEIERAYGAERVLHVSLEEFARTLTSRRENLERFREGGVRARGLSARLAGARRSGEVETFRSAFRRFRAFDRPNVLHLFPTFRPDGPFGREFPEAVQTGPLWPGRLPVKRRAPGAAEWVWYASPASAERIAPSVVAGLAAVPSAPHLWILTPRPWTVRLPSDRVTVVSAPISPREWTTRFDRAQVRVVTGSRTLLEAMEAGGPFLYFNGILGNGGRTRRHRPEKLTALLALAATSGVGAAVRADLADFGRGRRVTEIVRRSAAREGEWARFPTRWQVRARPAPFDDAGTLIVRVARVLGSGERTAPEIVARVRVGRLP